MPASLARSVIDRPSASDRECERSELWGFESLPACHFSRGFSQSYRRDLAHGSRCWKFSTAGCRHRTSRIRRRRDPSRVISHMGIGPQPGRLDPRGPTDRSPIECSSQMRVPVLPRYGDNCPIHGARLTLVQQSSTVRHQESTLMGGERALSMNQRTLFFEVAMAIVLASMSATVSQAIEEPSYEVE